MKGRDDDMNSEPGIPLESALDRLLALRGLSPAAVLARIDSDWDGLVGPEAAVHMKPRTLRGKELVVEVDHPAWATQVQLSSSQLLAQLREKLGERAPAQISVRVVPPR